MKLILLLLLLAIPVEADADSNHIEGVSYFALPGYSEAQAATALKVFDGIEHPLLGTIWEAFGDKNENIKAFMDAHADRPHTLHLYVTNETCRRPPRYCTEFDTVWPHLRAQAFNKQASAHPGRLRQALQLRIERATAFIATAANPFTNVILSTGLEDNYDEKTARIIERIYSSVWSGLLSRNPVNSAGRPYGEQYLELHSNSAADPIGAGAEIQSNDGFDLCFRGKRCSRNDLQPSGLYSALKRNKKHYSVFLWWWDTQGAGIKFNKPRSRSFRIRPKDVAVVNSYLRRLQK